jgi:putative restriction endonuclease
MLDKYLKSFSRLRTDKNHKRWPALTTHQAPHKPFPLLSIMDLIVHGSITENFGMGGNGGRAALTI